MIRTTAPAFALRLVIVAAVLLLGFSPERAFALKSIVVSPDVDRLEISNLGDLYEGRGDSIQLETAPGADGSTGRMSVDAVTAGTNPAWIVFALTNPTDRAVERWLTADRYSVVGSGIVWPDLDARRIEAITPSIGFVPERIPNERADIFRITLEPGQTITYVAELRSDRFARLHLWKPLEYELKVRDKQLFNGIMLGLTGLLAIFLTAIFAANHKLIFPAAALVAWCVLGLLCVDFGFFHKLFQLKAEDNAIYRAATESAFAASLVIFLHIFLRLGLWHGLARMLIGTWMIAQLSLVAISVIDPRLAATFARVSFAGLAGIGSALILFLSVRGQDRALSLVPTWLLFSVWVFGAALVLTGRLSGDMAVSALIAGLVLILLLIGFTVTQFAFRSLDTVFGGQPSELQLRSLAIDGAGASVWEWSVRRDEIKVGTAVEQALGLSAGELSLKTDDFLKQLNPLDRDRFRLLLASMQEKTGNRMRADFRLRHADNTYRWFEFEAATIPSSDGRTPKCVGLVRDVTESKRAHERLVQDAVHDNLTGLPNRELFLDRLGVAVGRAKLESKIRPALILIDIDKFKSVNDSFGLVVGDSLLLTAARRLQRHVGPQDTIARIGGDQFVMLFPEEQSADELAALSERIRRSLRSPVKIANQEIVLTGSIGIAVYDGAAENRHDLLKDAEIAMYRAKRGGADRIEVFRPDMRGERDERIAVESDLRKAIEKGQLRVLYQPIIYLPTEELAGFEALVRWEHPRLGLMNPSAFVPIAEESDLIVKIGSYVLARAAQDVSRWQKAMPRPDRPLFVSVNVSSRQLFKPDINQEIRQILGQQLVPKGSLRLEVTESLCMENPEQAVEMLESLRAAGADLALDDFGTGYSSLAYLHRLPCDTIKIDRSLLRTRGSGDGTGATIVRSMVALAHELQKKVVAEGVETPDDVSFLRGIGCEYAQGFYYGEPIADRDVHQLLRMIVKSERKLQPRALFLGKRKKRTDEAPVAAGANTSTQAAAFPPPSDVRPPMPPMGAVNLNHGPAGMPPPVPPASTPYAGAPVISEMPMPPAMGPVMNGDMPPGQMMPPLTPPPQVLVPSEPPPMPHTGPQPADVSMHAVPSGLPPEFAAAAVVIETPAHANGAAMPPPIDAPMAPPPLAAPGPSTPHVASAPVAEMFPRLSPTAGAALGNVDLSKLPPGIAAGLARLAGTPLAVTPNGQGTRPQPSESKQKPLEPELAQAALKRTS